MGVHQRVRVGATARPPAACAGSGGPFLSLHPTPRGQTLNGTFLFCLIPSQRAHSPHEILFVWIPPLIKSNHQNGGNMGVYSSMLVCVCMSVILAPQFFSCVYASRSVCVSCLVKTMDSQFSAVAVELLRGDLQYRTAFVTFVSVARPMLTGMTSLRKT